MRSCEYCDKPHDRNRFCSVACKNEWHKLQKREKNQRRLAENPNDCIVCKKQFIAYRQDQKFCSRQCKTDLHAAEQREARKVERSQVTKQCPICNNLFSPNRSLREIYCSKKCRECIGKKIYKMMQSCYDATESNKADHAHKVLGYSPTQLLEHLQTFPNWERLKKGSWHLDHVFPICAFTKKGIDDVAMICCLDNLQPLAGPKNCSKGGKYNEKEFDEWINAIT